MDEDPLRHTVTAKLDMFWLALATGRDEDVGYYLSQAGYSNVIDAIRDLHADVLECALDLRDRHEIEPAVELEKLASQMQRYLKVR